MNEVNEAAKPREAKAFYAVTGEGNAPRVDLKKALARIRKAHRYNLELAKTLREDGKRLASEYAEGSAFGFWQSAQILAGKAKA